MTLTDFPRSRSQMMAGHQRQTWGSGDSWQSCNPKCGQQGHIFWFFPEGQRSERVHESLQLVNRPNDFSRAGNSPLHAGGPRSTGSSPGNRPLKESRDISAWKSHPQEQNGLRDDWLSAPLWGCSWPRSPPGSSVSCPGPRPACPPQPPRLEPQAWETGQLPWARLATGSQGEILFPTPR